MKIIAPLLDKIERVRKEWRQELPELDTTPMETVGRILRAQFLAAAAMRRVFRAYDLDFGAFDVLATLRRSGPPYQLTPTQLYRELALTSGAMTHRMDALERAGLIERKSDPGDRRGLLAGLTRSGHTLVEQALKAHLQLETRLIAPLTRAEQAQLAQLLKKLLLGMEADDAARE
jgi:DNA-binding MarR family transcriptional regulator